MAASDDRAEVASWRRGRAGVFWIALLTVAAAVLVMAACDSNANVNGPGSTVVGAVLFLGIVLACVGSFVLVGAAALYGVFCILTWVYGLRRCMHPRWVFLFWSTILLVGSGSVWLGALDRLGGIQTEAVVIVGTVLFTGSVIGLLATDSNSTLFRGLTVDEGGLRLMWDHARYVEFRTLSTLRVFQDGLLDTDLMTKHAATSYDLAPVLDRSRVLVAQDIEGTVVVEFPLKGRQGRRIEEDLTLAYELWAQRPRRGHGLPTSWLARGPASLPSWLRHLSTESDRLLRQGAYRGTGYGIDELLEVFLDESLAQDVRAGAAFVLLRFLPDDDRYQVFESVGAMSPPLVSAAAWVAARRSVRRRRQPHGLECLSREDRNVLRKTKSDAWLPWRRGADILPTRAQNVNAA
jgi:hypothetical protein